MTQKRIESYSRKNNDKEMSLIERNALVKFGESYIETALRELDKLEKLSKEENK